MINISFIQYNTVFRFQSEENPWKKDWVQKGTFSEQKKIDKEARAV